MARLPGAPPLAQARVWLSTLVGQIEQARQHGLVLVLTHALGKDVGELGVSVDVDWSVDPARNTVAKFIRVAQDVLGLLECDRIGGKVDCRLAVEHQRRSF